MIAYVYTPSLELGLIVILLFSVLDTDCLLQYLDLTKYGLSPAAGKWIERLVRVDFKGVRGPSGTPTFFLYVHTPFICVIVVDLIVCLIPLLSL